MTLPEGVEVNRLPQAVETFFRYFANIAKKSYVLDVGEHFSALKRANVILALGLADRIGNEARLLAFTDKEKGKAWTI